MTSTRHRIADPLARTLLRALIACVAIAGMSSAHAQGKAQTDAQKKAQATEAAARALMAKYTVDPGRHDTDGLFKEPAVRAELQRVVGDQLPKLMQNINVRGSIAFDGGFTITGNANHKGGEEEGVVCISPFGPVVEAGIFSKGRITVFAKAEKYEYLMICVKDWITQVNSGHRDRFNQPKNVQLIVKP